MKVLKKILVRFCMFPIHERKNFIGSILNPEATNH
jgi:hypothetical protein